MPKEESLPMRKKMRKGTHSCFECRRRKIRCIFAPDNPEVCTECFARGSRCIDQENANPDVIVDHRKNLRERVSRLEALIDTLLEDKAAKSESGSQARSQAETSSPKAPTLFARETHPATPLTDASSSFLQNNQRKPSERGHHIPLVSFMEDALNDCERKAQVLDPLDPNSMSMPITSPEERYTLSHRHDDDLTAEPSLRLSPKAEKARQALIAMLPPYDQLTKMLNSNSEWWQTWRRKCSGTSGPDQTLAQFAAHALTTGNIGALGTVVLSVGICSSDEATDVDKYIEAVDRWVLGDDEYAASLEGMELLILKCKWYADVGQPRRAWIAYRKGIMYAQLMGLHRKRTTSAAHESIWWSLFHGDRFLSLLLGLPYGINDSHCDLTMPELGNNGYIHPLTAVTRLSQLAGRVIDRNQGLAEQSFAWALQIDQELEDIWKQLDPAWLEYTHLLDDLDANAAELRERLMGQMVFHQIRVYLHLPFMLKSAHNSRFTYSRTACLNGSREVLRLYQVLRAGTTQPLYECKAVDFIGFTAAVLVQIGLLNFGYNSANANAKEVEADVRLIEISIDIFRRASSEKGGKVALQSAEVLSKMMSKFKGNDTCSPDACPHGKEEFVIPYFGTISIKRGGREIRSHSEIGPKRPIGSISPSVSSTRSPTSQHKSHPHQQTTYTPPSMSDKQSTTGASDLFSQNQPASIAMTPKTSISAASSTLTFNDPSPFATYNGFYNWDNLDDASTTGTNTANSAAPSNPNRPTNTITGVGTSTINDDSMNNFPLPTNNFSWQHMPMDIDQDWSWFLNDSQTTGAMGMGAGGAAAQGQGQGNILSMDAFSAQGFTGFG